MLKREIKPKPETPQTIVVTAKDQFPIRVLWKGPQGERLYILNRTRNDKLILN